ncbi:MAG: DUF6768 family protein [Maricaulaceae bacterium]
MAELDVRLGEALSSDEAAFLKDLDSGRGLFTQLGATFQGPLKFWTYYVFINIAAFVALAIWCAFQLSAAETMVGVAWSAIGLWVALSAVTTLKMWLFQRMNHLALMREIKRLELRVIKLGEGETA